MAVKRAARTEQARKRLRIVAPLPIVEAPVLTFDEALRLYIGLMEQARQLGEHMQVIRTELLRTMSDLDISSVREEDFEVVRQVRRRMPRVDREKAEALLKRFGRLQECLVTGLDEEKARNVLNDLRATGKISERQLPYEYPPESEVLIVRRTA